MFKRKCPQCGKELSYTTKASYNNASNKGSKCIMCAQTNILVNKNEEGVYTKKCPKCKKEITFTTKKACRRSIRNKSLCKKCSSIYRGEECYAKVSKALKGKAKSEEHKANLRKGSEVKFDISGERHTFRLDSIKGDRVNITISSDAITVEMGVGDEEKVDVNADGYYDLDIVLTEIKSSKGYFVLTSIHEKISEYVAPVVEGVEDVTEDGSSVVGEAGEGSEYTPVGDVDEEDVGKTNWGLWIALVVILLVVAVLVGKKVKK